MIFFPVLWKRNSMSVPEQILSEQAKANAETTGFNPTDLIKAWPSQYIPVVPTPLQLGYCCLPVREMFYGGSAGGGKSEALLMAALQYVDIPGYSAIIFRKTFADLARNEGLLDRATKWLMPHLGKTVKYQPVTRSFHFSSGAVLAFGYMGTKGAEAAIQGAEYQFIGVDEVCQHLEADAKYATSRLRKKEGVKVPLRVRWTGNPGGIGHQWVKNYYQIKRNPDYDSKVGTHVGGHFFSEQPMFVGKHPNRMFIPARLVDNPYIDQEAYIPSLQSLDPLTRSQLLDGDWDASPSSRFRKEWFLRYTRRGDYITVGSKTFNIRNGIRFATVDVAASVREGVAGEQFYTRGGSMQQAEPCWTVISTWMVIDKFMFLLDVNRMQVEAPDIFAQMKRVMNEWEVRDFIVEGNGVGRPVAQVAQRQGLPVREIWTTHDKIQNSYTAANMAKAGQIVIPDERLELHWLEDFEGELFTWMGHPEETCDQVDTVSTAAKEAQTIIIPTDNITNSAELLPFPMGGMRSAKESSSMLPHYF